MRIIGNDPSVPRQAQFVTSNAVTKGSAVVINTNGTVSMVGGGNLTAENYIGIAASGAPSGTSTKINTKGAVDENQAGLIAGRSYYVQVDGTLDTTPANPNVFAGTAVSPSKIIVKG